MTTETNDKLTQLRELLAGMSAKDVKAIMATMAAEKPTALSVTADCYFAASVAGDTMTETIAKAVNAKCTEHGLEEPAATSTAALVRYFKALDAATKRAGYVIVKDTPAPTTDADREADATVTSAPGSDNSDKPADSDKPDNSDKRNLRRVA